MSKNCPNVAVLVGSLSKESINRKLALAIQKIAGARAQFHFVALDDLPVYNRDIDAAYPENYQRLKKDIESADAVLFVTPENNRSVPAVLKNAIDIASRPWGKNSFAHKPGAVIGTSTGAIGTALAQQHLRNICVFLDIYMMAQPESFIRFTEGLVAADAAITDDGTRGFLEGFVNSYLAWIQRFIQ
ncbi:NADPH-dependent FMN reductase [Castellaniella caeni]|uniref:NADPH-dependent FMN reductase n=1 Tax=Castellaniella caeni TaxID=266123 RepID=UPI000C9F151D|nr:NADPH-dependent FMN reductase [Castellaniella caeni]